MPRNLMQQDEWEQVKEVFTAALELPASQRTQFLADACGDDEALLAEVESLLAAHEEPQNLLDQHTIDLAAQLQQDGQKYLGKRFGPYRILREIGRGGMGAVFLAERADGEFQQQVALKIIRQSFADAELEKHFRRERQILASLTHPNIAKLIDGGVSESGELFLAMEFIAGEPLIGFAENHQLTIEERLRLFLKVCRAVSFAHQNLIIHRDLKPSNILVSDEGEPRLLDFGLAKLSETPTTPGGSMNADQTETAFRAFTPAYAAPEQILGKSVTTVSDVFSLGVILYELLTNEKPFHFEGKSLEEIIKTVSGDEPSLPSRTIKSEHPQSAIRQRQLRGDLDNITLKALQKDPARRYQSVAEFANDVERHLEHLPISARPNTVAYRASRFYQRNKIAVSAAAFVIVALIAGLGIALWQYSNARRENAKADAVNAFLQKMLLTAIPGSGGSGKKGAQATIVDVLDQADKRLDEEELSSQPEVRAELRQLIGSAYLNLGMYDAAERNLTRALDEQSSLFGRESPQTLKSEFELAALYLARADNDRAFNIYERRLAALKEEFQHQRIDPEFYAARLSNLAVICRARGDAERAEKLLRETIAVATEFSLGFQLDRSNSLLTLILLDQGRFAEAKSSQLSLVSRLRQVADTPEMPPALTLLGSILMENSELKEAEANLVEAEGIYRKLYGPEYTAIYDNIRLQAQVAYLQGDFATAEKQIEIVLEHYRKNSNPKYISFATALTIKGLVLNKLGKPAEAESLLREAVKLREENLPAKHFMTALTKGALGECLTLQKRFAEAEPLLGESYESLKSTQGASNPRTKLALQRLVALYDGWRRPDAANEYRKIVGSP